MNERDLRKHKYDVFRLLQIVNDDVRVDTFGLVKESIVVFLETIIEENLNLNQIGLSFGMEEGIALLKDLYFVL